MTFPQFVYRNLIRNIRMYTSYFLSSAFAVMIFFIYALFIFHPGIQQGVKASNAIQLMISAEWVMYLFSCFFVYYSVSTFLTTRKREFGILLMHGMTRRQLTRLIFLENMLIGVGALIAGIGGGMITGKLFLMIGSEMIDIDLLPFYFSWQAMALTIGSFLLLFLFISLFTAVFVRTNKLIDLFQTGRKPKDEPQESIVLSLFSAILLIVSYYLASTVTKESLINRALPVFGMMVVGTYFFYTQLSVFIVKRVQRNHTQFWKKTNLVTLSSLAYRLKDHARMFFVITIVFTVAFCAMGTVVSLKVIHKQFERDYPAAIGYVAKDGQPVHQQNLQQIKEELKEKKIGYSTYQFPIKYVAVLSATETHPLDKVPVVSFSDYRSVSKKAGFDFVEKPPTGWKALGMLTSQFDYYAKPVTYTLKQDRLKLFRHGFTDHVVISWRLVQREGLVVNDKVFERLIPVKTERFTGFFIKEFERTSGVGGKLVKEGQMLSSDNKPYAMAVSGTLLDRQTSFYDMMLFVALWVGVLFFIAAGSLLTFRLYADLDYDHRLYATLKKVGLTDRELNILVTRQLVLYFFVPVVVAVVHSTFAFMALQSYVDLSLANELIIVLSGFLLAQLIFFFLIRHRYLRNLKKALV